MPTTITSAGITFNDATSLTTATIPANAVGTTQIADGSVTAEKLGTTEQKQIAKAWVNFNGTTSPVTIRSSFNVSSVTKIQTGDYTVNFTTPIGNSDYSVTSNAATSVNNSGVSAPYLFSSANTTVRTFGLTAIAADFSFMSVQVLGN